MSKQPNVPIYNYTAPDTEAYTKAITQELSATFHGLKDYYAWKAWLRADIEKYQYDGYEENWLFAMSEHQHTQLVAIAQGEGLPTWYVYKDTKRHKICGKVYEVFTALASPDDCITQELLGYRMLDEGTLTENITKKHNGMSRKELLSQEFSSYCMATGTGPTIDTLLEFLELRGAMVPRYEMPAMAFGDIQYMLHLSICTDGDFCLAEVPAQMCHEDEAYTITLAWKDRDTAVKEALEFLEWLRGSLRISPERKWLIQDWTERIDAAIAGIQSNAFAEFYIGGNYEGTRFTFEPVN